MPCASLVEGFYDGYPRTSTFMNIINSGLSQDMYPSSPTIWAILIPLRVAQFINSQIIHLHFSSRIHCFFRNIQKCTTARSRQPPQPIYYQGNAELWEEQVWSNISGQSDDRSWVLLGQSLANISWNNHQFFAQFCLLSPLQKGRHIRCVRSP